MLNRLVVALGVCAFVASLGGQAAAQNKCQGDKIKAAGKKAKCKLSLEAKQASSGDPIDPLKIAKCEGKFSQAFAKAEGPGNTCTTLGDAAEIESKIDLIVAELDGVLTRGANKCQSSKLKAAGKKASCLLGLESKQAASGDPIDPTKQAKCLSKFSQAFAKAEAKPPCKTTGDAADIEARVDNLVGDVDCELDGGAPCDCGSTVPGELGFTTLGPGGNCGDVQDDTPMSVLTLACNILYIGGGGAGAVPPATVPDYGSTRLKTCCSGKNLYLRPKTAAETGSNRDCSAAGCLYGAPLPILGATPTCVFNEVAVDAHGEALCDAGNVHINIPLTSHTFGVGDQLPRRCDGSSGGIYPGRRCTVDGDCNGGLCVLDGVDVQPCPICNTTTGVCNGGANDGLPCTPGTLTAPPPLFPTSHDCPYSVPTPIANLAIPYDLTTGVSQKVAVDQPNQVNVFCGFCGNPSNNNFENPPHICGSNADCTTSPFTACKQRTGGAFGTAGRTITETGTAATGLDSDSGPVAGTLVSVFCIPPTFAFGGLIDANADLPGPGAASLNGTFALAP